MSLLMLTKLQWKNLARSTRKTFRFTICCARWASWLLKMVWLGQKLSNTILVGTLLRQSLSRSAKISCFANSFVNGWKSILIGDSKSTKLIMMPLWSQLPAQYPQPNWFGKMELQALDPTLLDRCKSKSLQMYIAIVKSLELRTWHIWLQQNYQINKMSALMNLLLLWRINI